MYISIIPLARSQSRYPSTYFVGPDWQESISIGGLVEIPLGNSLVEGVIFAMWVQPPESLSLQDIRPIVRVISSVPLLTLEMMSTVVSLAERYFLLIHKVLSLFLPAPLLTRLDKKNYILTSLIPEKTTPKKREIHHFMNTIFSKGDREKYLEPGTVFIFPDDIFLSIFSGEIDGRALSTHVGILQHHATPTKRSSFWMDTYEWKYDIIFWTRRILYYNLRAYTRIVYVEDAFATEQYSYPTKIQNLDILSTFAHTHPHDIIVVSSSPTLALLATFPDFTLHSIYT